MATTKSRARVWKCPRCGNTTTLFVDATEVICANPAQHTSTPVKMELSNGKRAASR